MLQLYVLFKPGLDPFGDHIVAFTPAATPGVTRPVSISAQQPLAKADSLGNDVDRVLST